MEIVRASSKVIPEIKNGDLTITVEVSEEGNIGDAAISSLDLSKPENIKILEEKKAAVIKEEITAALMKTKELNPTFRSYNLRKSIIFHHTHV